MVNSLTPDLPPTSMAQLLDRALQATDLAVVITDARAPGQPIVWVNDAFIAATGYTRAEVLGRNPRILQGPATDVAHARRLAQAVAEERAARVTLVNYRRDGGAFWSQVSISPVRDDAGRLTHWVGVQQDVSETVARREEGTRAVLAERRRGAGLGVVARVSDLLADLDEPHALRHIADLLMRDVVAWAGFFLDDNGLRPVDGIDLSTTHTGRRHRHGPPPQMTVHQQALELADAGAAVEAPPDPVQRLLDGTVDGPVELDLAADEGGPRTAGGWLVGYLRRELATLPHPPGTVTVLPVQGRSRVLGVLVAVPARAGDRPDGPERRRGVEDGAATVLLLTARRVGMAVENARLYAREHRLAEALQRAMLPEHVDVPGLDVWSHYAPSSTHAQVGGDWYDILPVGPGVVGIAVGDVAGHDIEAAAAMGQLRSVVRAYAYEHPSPGDVLTRVDHLVAGLRIPRSASLVLTTLRHASDGAWTLEYARAGHLPPVLVRDGQVRQLAAASGPLIGFGEGARTAATEELRAGDLLVLYTGGLIERRDRSLRDGVGALADACLRLTAHDAAGVGEQLLAALADAPEDDVAVVVVRVPVDREAHGSAGAGDPRQRRWLLPSEPGSIAQARHAVLRTCHTWQIDGAASAELVVSELMANAVLHGWGHVALRLYDTGEGLRIEVEDANPAPPVATDGHSGKIGGFGMQIVERLAEWGWRPSGSGKLVWARVRPSALPAPSRPPT
ncbi:SpoIIE family protein phosphatase [uncultured Cellulomonas sp.]|uniref:SpoIIE family protein phosphatase n=1 Tax=uncultured Cellulomonas sp. TaxID=189682 RepID=UPI00262810E9|nr:SpoIIE family protein phosphatase [uncultured Cellulomonas sp.]